KRRSSVVERNTTSEYASTAAAGEPDCAWSTARSAGRIATARTSRLAVRWPPQVMPATALPITSCSRCPAIPAGPDAAAETSEPVADDEMLALLGDPFVAEHRRREQEAEPETEREEHRRQREAAGGGAAHALPQDRGAEGDEGRRQQVQHRHPVVEAVRGQL